MEIPVGCKPIKYLYKYLTKGHYMTRVEMSGLEQDSNFPAQEKLSVDHQSNSQNNLPQETCAEMEERDETLRFTTYRFISRIEGESQYN